MDAKLIDLLASRDPRTPRAPSAAESRDMPMEIHGRASARFSSQYTNMAFGWYIATSFADARQMFPVDVIGNDHWLYRAYVFRLDACRYHDKDVMDAWALASLPTARNIKSKLCGLLLAGCGQPPAAHRRRVSDVMGIPLRVVEAFDTLFYNVLDRQTEAAFLSEQVYPEGRMVEWSEDYLKNADVADVLRRAGYNHRDVQLSAYLAGIGDQAYMSKLSARGDREQELTRQLMGNALLLVNSGALNQRSVGIARTQTLLAAARQGGQVTETPAVADAGDFVVAELSAALLRNDDQRRRLIREDAGEITELQDTAD